MRLIAVNDLHDNVWTEYIYQTTWKNGWNDLLYYVNEIAKVLEYPEFLVSEVGTTPTKLDIKSEAELLNVKESGTIWVRGLNKVWDNEQFQFIFYNQSKLIKMFVRTEYINSLKNPDGNAYTKDELNRVFDTFVDSIEINGRVRLSTDNGIEGQINSYIKALTQYDDIVKHGNSNNDDELYLFAYKHMRFPLGEVVKEIRQKKVTYPENFFSGFFSQKTIRFFKISAY